MGSGIDRFSSVSRGLLQRFIPEDQFSQTAGACGLCFAVLSLGLGLVPRDAQSSTGPSLLRRGGAGSQEVNGLFRRLQSESMERRVREEQESGHGTAPRVSALSRQDGLYPQFCS